MFLKNSWLLLFFLVFSLLQAYANEKAKELPELLTKQEIKNIRFISDDGKSTYFQKDSGSFHLTINYLTYDLIKDYPRAQFYFHASPTKKKVLVEVFDSFLKGHEFMRPRDIFEGDYLGKSMLKLDRGLSPRLHLDDRWYSFYDPDNRVIIYRKFGMAKEEISVKLKSKLNPYFIPHTIMLGETTVVLTDLLADGKQVLYRFDSLTGQFVQVFKTTQAGMKLEICRTAKQLFLGQFSLGDVNGGSSIYAIELDNSFSLKKLDLIYSSSRNDLGQMVCPASGDELYFIQAQAKESVINIKNTEAVKLTLSSKKVDILSNLGDASQLISLDSRILIPHRGKFYVIKGDVDSKGDDLIKKPEPKTKEPEDELML